MSQQNKSPFILLLLCTSLNSAFADNNSNDPCKTQANTIEMNECGKQTLAQKDKELNLAYQKLMKKLAPGDKYDDTNYTGAKKLLIEAQQNWIRFRDADCKGQYTLNEGGTIRGIVYLGCLTERTEQRTKELNRWIMGE